MGKRKVKRKAVKKLKDKLDSQFTCVFCNHEKSIECKIDHTNKVGHLACKICDVTWQCSITYLDEPVDVYSAWIDACEDVNQNRAAARAKARERERERDYARQADDSGAGADTTRSSHASQGRSQIDMSDPFGDDDDDDDF